MAVPGNSWELAFGILPNTGFLPWASPWTQTNWGQGSPYDFQEQVWIIGLAKQTTVSEFAIGLTTPYCSQPSQRISFHLFAGSLYPSKFDLSRLTGWVPLSIVWITDQPKLRRAYSSFINLTCMYLHKSDLLPPRSLSKLGSWSIGGWLTLFNFSLQSNGFIQLQSYRMGPF